MEGEDRGQAGLADQAVLCTGMYDWHLKPETELGQSSDKEEGCLGWCTMVTNTKRILFMGNKVLFR